MVEEQPGHSYIRDKYQNVFKICKIKSSLRSISVEIDNLTKGIGQITQKQTYAYVEILYTTKVSLQINVERMHDSTDVDYIVYGYQDNAHLHREFKI